MNREQTLLRRVLLFTRVFIVGLVLSGATAIPLRWEIELLDRIIGSHQGDGQMEMSVAGFLLGPVSSALSHVGAKFPFLYYGTDWLAFGHFVIALAFVGALRDPVRNIWLFTFGMIACVLVIPYALVFGAVRGIPIWWRLIDCSFGVFGFIPLWLCRKWTLELAGTSEAPLAS